MADQESAFRIELLADHRQTIAVPAEWFEREWAPYYGPEGPGDAHRDLTGSCNRDELPIALVAHCGDVLCGTAALKAESVSTHIHLTPWLAALLVIPEFRRRGVGERLIAAIGDKARRPGYRRIYAGMCEGPGTPESSLRKRGWEFIEKKLYFVSDISIFRKAL